MTKRDGERVREGERDGSGERVTEGERDKGKEREMMGDGGREGVASKV